MALVALAQRELEWPKYLRFHIRVKNNKLGFFIFLFYFNLFSYFGLKIRVIV